VLLLGDCDDGVRKLAAACGWLEELEEIWAKTAPNEAKDLGKPDERTKDEKLQEEVDKLTRDVEATLKLADDNKAVAKSELERMLKNQLARQQAPQSIVIGGETIQLREGSTSGNEKDKKDLSHVFPRLQGDPVP
jgi:NAD-dependent histone deacetylase SIR2